MIRIEHKFRPFSHKPGNVYSVPGSDYVVGNDVIPLQLNSCTVQQDLERQCIFIWGQSAEGYVRLKLKAEEEGLVLTGLRGQKFRRVIATGGKLFGPSTERLFLGCTKAQDWELMRRRNKFDELGPLLFFLGQQVPDLEARAAYTNIRKMLLDGMHVLPALPHEWHAGRATGLRLETGTLDLEWSRRTLRRMVFHGEKPPEFVLPKTFRCKSQDSVFVYDRFQK